MNTNPYVRVKRAFGGMKVGFEFRPPGVFRDRLVKGGLVEIISTPTPQGIAAEIAHEVNAEVQLPVGGSRRAKARAKVQTA